MLSSNSRRTGNCSTTALNKRRVYRLQFRATAHTHNNMSNYIFYFLSFLAVLSALMVVLSKNPVHSVLYLIITFFAIAGHYVLLNAQFLAAVHVIVYAGAIMVLFLYVIMY